MKQRIGFSVLSAFLTISLFSVSAPALAETVAPDRFPGVYIEQNRITPVDQRPDLSAGGSEFPDADGIIEFWKQTWTVKEDGSFVCRNDRWFKFLNTRPIRSQADPRIAYNTKYATLKINKAETVLPDGSVLEVPDYSFIPVASDDVAGWPTWINWRELVICFSGIQNDAVQHLDYEITYAPEFLPWIDADLRLNDNYPTVKRIVIVTIPSRETDGITVHLTGPESDQLRPVISEEDGTKSFVWNISNLAAAPSEPQCPAWQNRCNRLRFTSCFKPGDWAGHLLESVAKSAVFESEAIAEWAKETIKETAGKEAQAKKLVSALRKSITIVDSPKAWTSLENMRPADTVFDSSYANPLEAAALLHCALNTIGIRSAPCVAANEFNGGVKTPTNSVFSGILLMTKVGDDVIYLHPQLGEVTSPSDWGKHDVYPPTGEGWQQLLQLAGAYKNVVSMVRKQQKGVIAKPTVNDVSGVVDSDKMIPFAARGQEALSLLNMNGTITLDEEGNAKGEIRLKLTGLFYDPLKADTSGSQKGLARSFINHLLTGFKVESCSVQKLSAEECVLVAKVQTSETLTKAGDLFTLPLGDGPAFLSKVPMPLGRSYRSLNVELAGAFVENIDLLVQLPEDYEAVITPKTLGDKAIGQTITLNDNQIQFRRHIEMPQKILTPDQFADIRTKINTLRTDAALTVAVGKAEVKKAETD